MSESMTPEPMTTEEIVRYVVARAVWARRDPGDVLFPAGGDRAGLGPG
jgi:hypothetical protein